MRRRSMMTVAAVLLAVALLFTGCDLLYSLFNSIVGDWLLTFIWSGSPSGTASVTFNSDKTLTASDGFYNYTGNWSTSGKNITFTISNTTTTATYTGTYTQTTMSGTMTNTLSRTGTWSAVKDGARSLSAGDGGVDLLGSR